ncbi:MAG: FMN-binding protein [Proteobacteria bacterium]|nr:FMN-binding protein [Pseudomonadota bacterium]MBU1420168.1 FMN-binding protein [Pseudomonadota bacterium]MBU1456275.1 FMN-binding protein [Pseudomonadota bacterium]
MKDMITIVVRLTVSCVLAATVMGLCFIFTSNAKKHNEHIKEQQVMYELLGYKDGAEIPGSLALHEVYRYVISSSEKQSIGYVVPQGHGEETGFIFVNIDLNGVLIETKPIALSESEVLEAETRNKAVLAAVGPGYEVSFADQTIVVTDNGKRIAYLLGGKFQGFKTFVSVMLAVDPAFTLIGMEILEHEEDPGLGAEIEQDYFKNQFKGKPFEALKTINVVKAPIPADYLKALNGKVSEGDILKFREQYKDHDIYALTGATISSRAVSNGVKGIVTKFSYRVNVLDKVLKEQQLAVSF